MSQNTAQTGAETMAVAEPREQFVGFRLPPQKAEAFKGRLKEICMTQQAFLESCVESLLGRRFIIIDGEININSKVA